MFNEKIIETKEFLLFLLKRAKSDAIFRVSSALSYTSLLALVPLISIMLAIFSAFPIFAEFRGSVEEFIIRNLLPDIAQDVQSYITTFVAASGKLTAIGIVSIIVVAILMLSTIENSFNFIFKAYKPRQITTKITLYWTFLTLGPLLLGAAFSLRGYMAWYPQDALFNKLMPNIITYITLIMVYVLVPNKKIKIKDAMIGALVSVFMFWLLRMAFGYFVSFATTYKTLYGALSVIPIFLIWMYLAWSVVIFGAVVTASMAEYKEHKKTLDNRTNLEHTGRSNKTNKRKK